MANHSNCPPYQRLATINLLATTFTMLGLTRARMCHGRYSSQLKVMRKMNDGFEENLALTNYSQKPLKFEFAIHLEADFVDQDEVSKHDPRQKGHSASGGSKGQVVPLS